MNRQKRPIRLLFFSFLLVCLLAGLAGVSRLPTQVQAAPQMQAATDLVISEFRFRGSGGGNDEFVEIFNPTASQVNLNGWMINGSNNAGGTSTRYPFTADFFLQPGQHYLIAHTGYNDSVPADVTYGTGITADGGVALIRPDNSIADQVGLSNGSAYKEGTVLAGFPSDTDQSYERQLDISGSCTDSNNNSADFFLRNPSDPQNSTSLLITCGNPTQTPSPTSSPTSTNTSTSTPTAAASLSLLINEVAWAGTVASSSDEWFELYNPGATNINLNGWSLTADDGNPSIPLSGTILAGDYFVVARYSAVFSDLTVDLTYSSGTFDNAGEILYLLDPNGNQVDRANSDGGAWPAGLASTYATMERLGVIADGPTAWATYGGTTPVAHDRTTPTPNPIKGTPGQGNWITTVTVTPSPTTTATRTPTVSRTPTKTRTPTKPRTPTRRPTVAPQPLVAINEALPRPGHDWNHDGKINTDDEYIELINHGVIDVNLNGYRLDDEANIGSTPYTIPSITIKPGERIVFYGGVTGLLLSDGGDGVRLLRPNGQLMDAFNYSVVFHPDQAYCRLPDNGGADDWTEDCFPTPGLRNALGSSVVIPDGTVEESLCPISDSLPIDFVLAECPPFGNNIWRPAYWDDPGWLGDEILPETNSKWSVYVD